MAGYDDGWRERQGGWSGSDRGPRREGWSQGPAAGGRGNRAQGGQPWPSRRPRGTRAWSGTQGNGYGVEYKGKGWPYGTGYRPGSAGDFGSAGNREAGYDFGYQGGEFGRPRNAPWGPRGSYGTPSRPAGQDWSSGGRGPYRGDEYNAAYGRDYEYDEAHGWTGESRAYRRGRGTGYGADFGQARGGGGMGSDDFGGRLHRHYGRTPADRWPTRNAAPPRAEGRMSDDDVRESVRENLFQDSFVDPDRIEVEVERGVVTLRGEVDDFLEARYAWDDAWESPGVHGVINNLTVRTDQASDEMDMPQTRHESRAE